MTAPCPPGCGHDAPGPVPALCDVLGLCADAVDEAGFGRHGAQAAWEAARAAASRVTAAPEVAHALGLVLAAARPEDADASWRPGLWRALSAASLALCLAADGDQSAAGDLLLDACGHADGLPCSPPLRVVLTAAWDQAREQVTA
jgi:hypothetical protein